MAKDTADNGKAAAAAPKKANGKKKAAIDVKHVNAFSCTDSGDAVRFVALDGQKRTEQSIPKKPGQKLSVKVDIA